MLGRGGQLQWLRVDGVSWSGKVRASERLWRGQAVSVRPLSMMLLGGSARALQRNDWLQPEAWNWGPVFAGSELTLWCLWVGQIGFQGTELLMLLVLWVPLAFEIVTSTSRSSHELPNELLNLAPDPLRSIHTRCLRRGLCGCSARRRA